MSANRSHVDLLTRVRQELQARMAELAPAVEEHARLEAALVSLDAALEEQSGLPRSRRSTRSRRTKAARRRQPSIRQRAPRGANRAAILSALRERPGASAGELADAAGLKRATAYNELSRLTGDGQVQRTPLPGGGSGYSLTSRAAQE